MNNRPSSSRSDRGPRGPWPWILAAGPIAVVVASLASAWLAVSRADPLVEEDYYKIGLTINRTLAATPPAARDPDATIDIGADGAVRVRLQNATSTPPALRLALRRPGEREGGRVSLRARDGDEWAGTLNDLAPGIRILTLESDAWRLPVTVVERLPARIRLQAAGPHTEMDQ
ncbi:MAG: FixH family protein [Rudaea sp.]